MAKRLVIFGTTKKSDWISYVFSHIEKFKKTLDSSYVIEKDIKNLSINDEVILVGYSTSKIVETAIKLKSDGYKVKVIENLCCDDDVSNHLSVIDKLFFSKTPYERNFKFLCDEIISVVRKSLENSSGVPSNFTEDDYFNSLNYDSLDIVELVGNIEDKFNTHLPKSQFAKFIKVKDIVGAIESGKISNKFRTKK